MATDPVVSQQIAGGAGGPGAPFAGAGGFDGRRRRSAGSLPFVPVPAHWPRYPTIIIAVPSYRRSGDEVETFAVAGPTDRGEWYARRGKHEAGR